MRAPPEKSGISGMSPSISGVGSSTAPRFARQRATSRLVSGSERAANHRGPFLGYQRVNPLPSLKGGLNSLQGRVFEAGVFGQPFDGMQRVFGTVPALITTRQPRYLPAVSLVGSAWSPLDFARPAALAFGVLPSALASDRSTVALLIPCSAAAATALAFTGLTLPRPPLSLPAERGQFWLSTGKQPLETPQLEEVSPRP